MRIQETDYKWHNNPHPKLRMSRMDMAIAWFEMQGMRAKKDCGYILISVNGEWYELSDQEMFYRAEQYEAHHVNN